MQFFDEILIFRTSSDRSIKATYVLESNLYYIFIEYSRTRFWNIVVFENRWILFPLILMIKPKVKETCELEINDEIKLTEKEEVPKEKSVHFEVNEQKPQSKIDSVLDELKNRPQNEIIGTLLELIQHQVRFFISLVIWVGN